MDSQRGEKEQIEARISTATTGVASDTCSRPGSGDPSRPGSQSPGSDKLPQFAGSIVALALTSEDMEAVACALNLLRPSLPLDRPQEEALDKRMSALLARGAAIESPDLARAITHFLYARAQQRASAIVPFVPALLSFLDQDLATTGAYSYYTLMILAEDVPEDLLPFANALIDRLASPGYSTRTLAVRIITALADKRPGPMAIAREPLRDLTESCEDGILKTEAMKALQAIEGNIRSGGGDEAIADRTATVSGSRQLAGHNCRLAILARLMNLRRMISRSGGDRKATGLIAGDLQEITRWIEAEFPANGEVPFVKNAGALPEESPRFFSPKIKADVILPKTIQPLPPAPDRQVAVERQSPEIAAQVSESNPRAVRSGDEAETARLREMMAEVKNDFSINASQILDALGIEHLKPAGKDETENRTITAGEFRLALEKILAMQDGKALATSPARRPPDDRISCPEAKGLLGEIRRDIDDSLITANEPVKSIAENFLKPAGDPHAVDIKRPDCGGHPEKKRASFKVRVMKKDGKIYRYYDRDI